MTILAAALLAVGMPQADAAPKKGKKAKKAVEEMSFDILSDGDVEADRAARKAKSDAAAEAQAELDSRSAEERREDNKMLKEETKFYISN